MKRALLLLPLVLAAGCSDSHQDLVEPAVPAISFQSAPASGPVQAQTNDWIVVFKPGVADPPGLAMRLVGEAAGNLKFTYQYTIQGFAATLPPQALEGVRNNPNVLRVEPDVRVSLAGTETAASWGLDRVDERDLPMDGYYTYDSDGSGVTAYILDTGIRTTHTEFQGRAFKSSEADFIGGTGDDCHGHGTHVAGTVGGVTYGIAKGVTLQAVRVLDCNGSGALSGVIAGIDWVTAQHLSSGGPSVANMSLSAYDPFGFYGALNDAVAASVDAGVVFAVAASNDNGDACDYIPASEPQALTVGATSSTDARASFSNYGYCVDLFAPGVGITSAYYSSDVATATWSGTSMASPHVAGVAALYLSANPTANPTTVKYNILTKTTDGVVTNPGPGSPNKLLYSRVTEGGTPPPPPSTPPAAPTGLVATAVSSSQIDLSWIDNAGDEDHYEIERSSDGSTFALLATLGPNVTSYSDYGLPAEAQRWYQVRATNTAGPSGYSNVDEAVTDPEPPPPADVNAEVWQVSDVTILSQTGKFVYAVAGVAIAEAGSGGLNQLEGVVVTGDWWWSGDAAPFTSFTGVTDGFGWVTAETGKVKVKSGQALHFCVTSLSGTGFSDGTTYPACDAGFEPPNGTNPPPPDPGDPQAPSGLGATWSSKGGGRVELSWTPGGGAEVDVFRSDGGGFAWIATTADNGKFNDRDGASSGVSYQVCMVGTGPQDSQTCSNTAGPGGI